MKLPHENWHFVPLENNGKKNKQKKIHKYDASQKATTVGAMTFRLPFKGRKMAHLMADLPTQHL